MESLDGAHGGIHQMSRPADFDDQVMLILMISATRMPLHGGTHLLQGMLTPVLPSMRLSFHEWLVLPAHP